MKIKDYWFNESLILVNNEAFLGDFSLADNENVKLKCWKNMGFIFNVGEPQFKTGEDFYGLYCVNYENMIKAYGSLCPDLTFKDVEEKIDKFILRN